MVTINKGFVEYKQYKIPMTEIEYFIKSHDDLLLEISMSDLKDMFIFGIPSDFKDLFLKKVRLYDASSKINSFKINGKEYWLDKLQRSSILNLLKIDEDNKAFDLILGDEIYNVKKEKIEDLLNRLELYAYKCKVTTQRHLNNISSINLPTNGKEEEEYIQALINYDYTKNYPEKIELSWL